MKISEAQYKYAQRRVEELLEVVTDTTLPTSPESIELSIMRIREKVSPNRETHACRSHKARAES